MNTNNRIDNLLKLIGWIALAAVIGAWTTAAALEWSGSFMGFVILVATWLFIFGFALVNL